MPDERRHVVFLHAWLGFTGGTTRLAATARALRDEGTRVTIVAGDGSQRDRLEREGFDIVTTDLPREPWKNPFAVLRLRNFVAELAPTLMHITSEELAALGAWIARWLPMPYVLEVHRPVAAPLPHVPGRLAAVGLSAPTLAVSVVNQGHIARDLCIEVPHAPEPAEGPPPTAFGHENTLRIGTSGLLDARHGTEILLDAVHELKGLERPLHFMILGEGPNERRLRERVRKTGLSDRVTIAVPTTHTAAETLAALDCHVSCRVGGPDWLAHLALALGVPSILTGTGPAFELVEDGTDGVLVEREDPGALALKIAELVEAPLVARTLGLRARARWREEHPPGTFARSVAAFHAKALPVEA